MIPGRTVRPTGIAPENEWQVAMRCDERPTPWPYGDDLMFAPEVSMLSPLRRISSRNAAS